MINVYTLGVFERLETEGLNWQLDEPDKKRMMPGRERSKEEICDIEMIMQLQ